ncbi:MAG: hypothetical protein BWZ02_01375 [Lentisphaerae bacterium ADurb.BinA184]|nr:MAG: hypothetical protein BWZ02_01375 [Lentisphaerae bacterium ADurb.BinA184]
MKTRMLVAAGLVLAWAGAVHAEVTLRLDLPLGRGAYQTNEFIDLAVVRASTGEALAAGTLGLKVTGTDGSAMGFVFPARAVAAADGGAQAVEHLRLNGWLLRPGAYTVEVACDGATARADFDVYPHVRRSTYKLIHWGGSRNDQMAAEGDDGMGFNLAWGETGEESIASGQDVMGSCVMGGCHQHDCKTSNDWSDPNVYIGAIQRGLDRAFSFRTMPNAIGAHLHDEPGLTWLNHPYLKGEDGKPLWTAHDIAFQRAAFQRVFGEEMPWFDKVDTTTPEGLAQWRQVCEFKLGLMDAFWKASRHALERLKPGYLAVTQSQYGWTAYHDGYYFNVVRSMPVVSGHGGYNDFWLRNFNPSFFLEFALPRQLDKPTWYLPEWYAMTPAAFSGEHNLSFITGVQGLATPPGLNAKSEAAPGITASNRLFARLGTIFAKPQYTRQDLAILYSKSNIEYQHGGSTQPGALAMAYLATRLTQYPVSVVLDEDILDGTLAAGHKAVLLTGLVYLDPAVVAALEAFAQQGGAVLVTADCKVKVAGATGLDVMPEALWKKAQEELKAVPAEPKEKRQEATAKTNSFRAVMEYAAPLAKALKTALPAKGVRPAFASNVETVCAGRQVRGEIEYIFAVNFTPEPGYSIAAHGYGVPAAAKATLGLPDDGRPIHEVAVGAPVAFQKQGQSQVATVEFGPGQMLMFARPARPVGGVQVGTPVINQDFTREGEPPIRLELAATLVDTQNRLLAGAAPLEVTVTDPLGVVRYSLYRATDNGVCALTLPLAANDAAGNWTVSVKELLTGKTGSATVAYRPSPQCGALAGAVRRAIYFEADKANVYTFFRNHRQIGIVAGTTPDSQAAAQRLAELVKPYNVTATLVPLDQASQPRPLTDEEAKTWCGTATAGDLDANARKNPVLAGYNLPQPTVLLGNPQDNPLIKRLLDAKVLPYKPTADFPGRGRGMVAWNLMTLGHDVEVIACIANDTDGLNEAVGTLFALGIGLDPLTPFALPASSSVTPASQAAKR